MNDNVKSFENASFDDYELEIHGHFEYRNDLVAVKSALDCLAGKNKFIRAGICIHNVVNVNAPMGPSSESINLDFRFEETSVGGDLMPACSRLGFTHLLDLWLLNAAISHLSKNNNKGDVFVSILLESLKSKEMLHFVSACYCAGRIPDNFVLMIVVNDVEISQTYLEDFVILLKRLRLKFGFEISNISNGLSAATLSYKPDYIVIPFDKYVFFKHKKLELDTYQQIFARGLRAEIVVIASSIHSVRLSAIAYSKMIVVQQGRYWKVVPSQFVCDIEDVLDYAEVAKGAGGTNELLGDHVVDARNFGKGLLVALPLSLIMWLGIFFLVTSFT